MRKFTPREENGLLVALICILLAIAILMFTSDAHADDGIYFDAQLGYIDDNDWDDGGGIPARLELGYRVYDIDFLGQPSLKLSWLHLSNFEGGFLAEFGENDETSLNFYGVGFCWGAC